MTTITSQLLEIGAIKLSPSAPFTWASGIQSPIYCDNRISLSYPALRSQICEGFISKIHQLYPHVEAIAGVATGGIAHGALVADRLQCPFAYVRDKPKGHGRENIIEGHIEPGSKVVVIEDLISTGGSSLKAVEALREYGVEVIGLIAIFTYNFQKAIDAFKASHCSFSTLTSFQELISEIEQSQQFKEEEISYMKKWYQQGI